MLLMSMVVHFSPLLSSTSLTFLIQPSRQQKPLFCLIIGIDNYQSPTIPVLSGAVADSVAVRTFFSSNKHAVSFFTPDITHLTNEKATRDTILKELHAFQSNSRIRRGDPMLIYYAGHGSASVPESSHWTITANQKEHSDSQSIVPYDCDEFATGIPYRTIATCLNRLSEVKGNNIVSYYTYTVTRGKRGRFTFAALYFIDRDI